MDSDEQAIRDLIATWLQATNAADAGRILNLIADDALFMTPGQPPMSKADFAAAQAGLGEFDIEARGDIQEVLLMCQWAWCRNLLHVTIRPRKGGASIRRSGQAMSLFEKRKGSWQLIRDANLLTVEP